MSEIYSYQNNKLCLNDKYKELWKLIRYEGKHILPPENTLIRYQKTTQRLVGKIAKNGACYFEDIGFVISLNTNYDNKIKWKTDSNIKIGFYSPCRNIGNSLYLNVDDNDDLTVYKENKGTTIINCHQLIVFLSDFYRKCSHHPKGKYYNKDITIKLKITSLPRNNFSQLKIFHVETEGIFYYNTFRSKYKKVAKLIKEYYEKTSIQYNLYLTPKLGVLPPSSDYNNILAKSSYQNIFSVTTQIKPSIDRDGYYGIVIKRDPNVISSATISYQINISNNILATPDVIVMAAYYDGMNYVIHQVNQVEVINTHVGPYPNDNNIIKGKLLLESTSIDITLIISNSLYGLLPIDGQDPDTIITFKQLEISYDAIER